ncbi:MFS transporter [Bacillus sp. V3B]|uniref:MFS transporter n=1 Tax=Bacillus sp. V3B TaxID=2804915 RepID=UPI00210A1EA4|nr:MFS transporter [Bacillus sp. V3B]MCQ6277438.1 MFS transporter [Bacillus sp. V3B]
MGIKELRKLERPMLILMLGVLLSHLGTYMVVPILPIMLRIEAGFSLVQIGTILAAIAISFQFGSIIGGFLADRIGRRFIIGLGALIGASGLIGFGLFTSYWLLLLMAITIGAGNGLNAPSTKAAIAALASKDNQTTAFSLRGIAANIGTGTAGLIVFFLITGSSKIIFWVAGTIYLVLTLKSWLLLPKNCGDASCPDIPPGAYREVLKNKPFIVFGAVSIFIWALYAQLALALPLRAADILPDPKNVALIWTINSAIVILSQGIVTNKIINRFHPFTALGFGMVFIGFGIGSLYWSSSFIHLVISGAIFVLGEMLILPTIDSTVSQLSKAELIGIFFALANVVSGIGEAGGKFVGGKLLDLGTNVTYLPWTVYAVSGLFLFIIVVFILKRWGPLQLALQEAANKPNGPKHAPKVSISPNKHSSHPYNGCEPEVFWRKRGKI